MYICIYAFIFMYIFTYLYMYLYLALGAASNAPRRGRVVGGDRAHPVPPPPLWSKRDFFIDD